MINKVEKDSFFAILNTKKSNINNIPSKTFRNFSTALELSTFIHFKISIKTFLFYIFYDKAIKMKIVWMKLQFDEKIKFIFLNQTQSKKS